MNWKALFSLCLTGFGLGLELFLIFGAAFGSSIFPNATFGLTELSGAVVLFAISGLCFSVTLGSPSWLRVYNISRRWITTTAFLTGLCGAVLVIFSWSQGVLSSERLLLSSAALSLASTGLLTLTFTLFRDDPLGLAL